MEPKYKRVILKISGEALAGESKFGLNEEMLFRVAKEIKEIRDLGTQIAIVIGGGNFWRGRTSKSMDRATADYMGMLATVINAMALQDAFEAVNIPTRVQTAIEMKEIAEPYIRRKAISELKQNQVVIFAAGTGSPYFSTDTTAALRATEIKADIILMAKNGVDGVYSADPKIDNKAEKYDKISHMDIINNQLGIIDATAASMCHENDIDLIVFNINEYGNIKKAVNQEKIGTMISKY